VNLNLSLETAKRLADKAAQEGHILEPFLENLAELDAGASNNGTSAEAELQEKEERPW